ncbi:vacuolar iron transporter homolog 4-like [Apium graveolens]|uniref:vacuolar iron transporter homolog 4-like n=1 Tax=Apium graveolens TaxID=4045 RepID=UPI003D7A9652
MSKLQFIRISKHPKKSTLITHNGHNGFEHSEESEKEQLPNPFQAALASALAFLLGALVPLLVAAFKCEHKMRLIVVNAAVTFSLVVFGAVGAVLGNTPAVNSCARLLIGGCIAMAIIFGLTKLIASHGL